MKQEYLRCFVAIDLPEEIKNISEKIQLELKKGNFVDAKYTARENLHLTLKFLGEIDALTLKKVSEKLKRIKFDKFSISLGEAGVFSEEEIRIVWLSLNGEGLHRLQKAVDEELKEIREEEFRFMAHITLARVRNTLKRKELLDYLSSLKLDGKEHEIKEFTLKKSVLTDKGPVYSTMEVYPAQNFK